MAANEELIVMDGFVKRTGANSTQMRNTYKRERWSKIQQYVPN